MVKPLYLDRSWWADASWPRGGAQLVAGELHKLGNVCHYPGRASAFGSMTLANLRSNIRGWYLYHVKTRGWADIGYQACVSMTTQGPVVVDLRGIGRVPAAHASTSNPRANWHGGATLWTIGNTETPHPDLIEAYRHFRTNVWLKRWATATGVTHHRRVPGAQTACAGDKMEALVASGTLRKQGEDNMPNLDSTDLKNIYAQVRKALDTPFLRTWSDVESNVRPADGGRYAFYGNSAANKAVARLTALEALVAQLVAQGANDLTEQKVKDIIEGAVIKVDVTVEGVNPS
jgi:hypothetical protein